MADTPIKWDRAALSSNILSTDLDSKTSSATAINMLSGTNILDMSDGEYMNVSFELVLGSLAVSAGGYVRILLWRSVDGTNYIDQHIDNPCYELTKVFLASTAEKRQSFTFQNIDPFKYKIGIIQATGSTTASSGNTLKYVKYREKGVS
jgi:hypothetical protein